MAININTSVITKSSEEIASYRITLTKKYFVQIKDTLTQIQRNAKGTSTNNRTAQILNRYTNICNSLDKKLSSLETNLQSQIKAYEKISTTATTKLEAVLNKMRSFYLVSDLVNEVIRGNWGSGATRKQRLTDAGYDYDTVQNAVNAKLGASTWKEVTQGGIPGVNTVNTNDNLSKIESILSINDEKRNYSNYETLDNIQSILDKNVVYE